MNLEEEIRDGYTISREMKQLWAVELDLTKKLLEVCHKHNLRIWADSGTLLGAIRHGGFIPWDDDMDFIMLREDYDKLVKLAYEFPAPYFLQSGYTEKGYDRMHIQLRRSDTSCILPPDKWQRFNQGVFIDILPLDYVSGRLDDHFVALKRAEILRSKMKIRTYATVLSRFIKCNIVALREWLYFKTHGFLNTYREVEEIYRTLNTSGKPPKDDGGLLYQFGTSPWGKRRGYHISVYSETLLMPFEDIQLPVPVGWDERLRVEYGDNYMTPIQAPTAHGFIVFDVNRPYKEFVNELRKKADWKERFKAAFMLPHVRN